MPNYNKRPVKWRMTCGYVEVDVSTNKHPNCYVKLDLADWLKIKKLFGKPYLSGHPRNFYAIVWAKKKRVPIHRLIMDTPDGLVTDHINRDSSDNRRKNLRVVTSRQNSQNRRDRTFSKYPGVNRCRNTKKWRADSQQHNKKAYLGTYDSEFEAFCAYGDYIESIGERLLPEWEEKLKQGNR